MERIGRYEILGEVGRGGMGVVYRGTDPRIGRSVAIKVIRLQDADNPQEEQFLRERLFREARSAGVLSHPGIVTIYEIEEQGGLAYIAMEFVNGTTLEKLLLADVPPKKETILRVVKQTASALDFAHRKGIVHRDVKPANIMIDEDGTVKICDFGVAKIFDSQKSATQTGLVMGSPSYMSPEQIQGKPVNGRSDQFSLAVVTFRMLAGLRPFQGDTLPALMYKIIYEPPPPIDQLNPTLGQGIKKVLERALAKDPASRFASCSDFAEALVAACDQNPYWEVAARPREDAPENDSSEAPAADPLPSEPAAVPPKAETAHCSCGAQLAPGESQCKFCASFGATRFVPGTAAETSPPPPPVEPVLTAQPEPIAEIQQTELPSIATPAEAPVRRFPYWIVGLIGLAALIAVVLAMVFREPQSPVAGTPVSIASTPPPEKAAVPIPQAPPPTEAPAPIPPKRIRDGDGKAAEKSLRAQVKPEKVIPEQAKQPAVAETKQPPAEQPLTPKLAPPPPVVPAVEPCVASKEYFGALSGRINWSGRLDSPGTVVIHGSNATQGAISSGKLPRTRVDLDVTPSDVRITEVPSERNGCNQITVSVPNSQITGFTIQWKVRRD